MTTLYRALYIIYNPYCYDLLKCDYIHVSSVIVVIERNLTINFRHINCH